MVQIIYERARIVLKRRPFCTTQFFVPKRRKSFEKGTNPSKSGPNRFYKGTTRSKSGPNCFYKSTNLSKKDTFFVRRNLLLGVGPWARHLAKLRSVVCWAHVESSYSRALTYLNLLAKKLGRREPLAIHSAKLHSIVCWALVESSGSRTLTYLNRDCHLTAILPFILLPSYCHLTAILLPFYCHLTVHLTAILLPSYHSSYVLRCDGSALCGWIGD